MDLIAAPLLDLVPTYGPWVIFVLAILETCFVTGLVVPSGVATSVGTGLALQGSMEFVPVVAAALAGGGIGDALGFWIGRLSGKRLLGGQGRIARSAAQRHADLSRFFGRHPLFSVSVARLVSFARTLMPMAAGMSGLSFRRYLPYELVGLVGWAALYVGIGVAAGESWEIVTRFVGAGGAALFAVVATALWRLLRRRGRRRTASGAPSG